MATDIKCPKCGFGFPMEEAVSEDYKKELREKMLAYQRQKDEEIKKQKDEFEKKEKGLQEILLKNEEELSRRVFEEKNRLRTILENDLRKDIASDFENRIKMLTEANQSNDEKLREARRKELEYLKKEQELLNREEELQLTLQKRLIEEKILLSEQIRIDESKKSEIRESEYQFRLKEMEKQLDDQKRLAEEMRRKAEQGSMQLQGEAQELLLEDILRENFPYDVIEEVGKGVEGADCMMVVRNAAGLEYGKIIFESKRTKAWHNSWMDKLKSDMRSKQADLAILVTQVFPKNMACFGEKDGVWICTFKEVIGLTSALRTAVIRIAETKKSEENRGDKMHLLYNFLTGTEFRQQVEAIVEGFVSMKNSIIRERIQMEKLWKEREKQLEKVLLNTSGMYGSIKGIAGSSVSSIPLLDGTDTDDEVAE